MIKESSTKIVDFMTLGARILVLRHAYGIFFFTCIHLDGMMRGSVFRWILLPRQFDAVHYSLQRCADLGDQVPARNHLALQPIYWSSICLLIFSTTTKMLSLSLCTDTLSISSCLLL